MKLHLQKRELEILRDLINIHLENDDEFDYQDKYINTKIGAVITDRLTRKTMEINITKISCLGKVEFTIKPLPIDKDELTKEEMEGYEDDVADLKEPKRFHE